MAAIGLPSTRGVTDSLVNYGVGALGGLTYNIASNAIGSGLFGGIIAAALAGSVVKGAAGDTIAVMAGFNTFQSGGGLDALPGVTSQNPANMVM